MNKQTSDELINIDLDINFSSDDFEGIKSKINIKENFIHHFSNRVVFRKDGDIYIVEFDGTAYIRKQN